ncbi:MAG: hypothetical protein QXD24_07895 [Candidatus Caldarchaeum sp.]
MSPTAGPAADAPESSISLSGAESDWEDAEDIILPIWLLGRRAHEARELRVYPAAPL